MKLYIDCEFNGGFGQLISMALVAEDGREFYEVLPFSYTSLVQWVADNVIPILGKEPVSHGVFQARLGAFLASFKDGIELVADHPADLAYFFNALLVDNMGSWLNVPPVTARIIRTGYDSAIPHNALEDARAIMLRLAKGNGENGG